MSLNKVMLIGRLDDKPQIREIEHGRKLVGLAIVTTHQGRDPNTGEEHVGKEWHRVVVIEERLAAFAEAHLQQNDQVYIEGQLHTERWQDETHQWRSLTKILLSQGSDQLQKFMPGDDPVSSSKPCDPMLIAAREAQHIETSSPDVPAPVHAC